jgi:ParB family chromosome partitioning protein
MSATTIAADVQDTTATETTDQPVSTEAVTSEAVSTEATNTGTSPEPVGQPDTGEQHTTETDPATETDLGYLVHLDPRTLVLEDNIRTDDDLDDAFVESVRDNGVLLPVRAYLAADDARVTVRDGRRRVLAAIQAERPTIPVYVTDPGHGAVPRITQQYDANERRAAMTDTDRIGAWKQLQLAGLSLAAIAKATHEKRTHVKAGLDVIASTTATQAVVEHDLTLDQAATLIEFEDEPKAVKKLLTTARTNPSGFAHEAQRLRDQRKTDQQIAELTAQYAERGIQVIAWPSWENKETVRLSDLTEADGSDLNPDTFATRPGYRVAIRESYDGVEVGHFVTDWRKHGLKKRRSGGAAATGWTEQQKRERRELIANNKAWPSAEVVRREWLTAFLARKTTPRDALAFVATVAAVHPDRLATALTTHQEVAASLLGGTYEWGRKHPLASLIEANPAKATIALLAVALGALEQATSKNTWRFPSTADVTYFTALKTWGYTLSDVENLVLGITPEPAAAEPDDTEPDEPMDDEQEDDDFDE